MEGDATDRLRGVLLAGAGVVVLLAGGWWWRAEAPTSTRADIGITLGGTYWGDPRSGAVVRGFPEPASSVTLDASSGVVTGPSTDVGSGPAPPGQDSPRWQERTREVEWGERGRLRPGDAIVRRGQLAAGEARLLRFSCTGPGEMLIQVAGARAADPMTVGCDGTEAMIEIIGTGGPAQVSFSPAGSESIEVRAWLAPIG